MAEQTIWLLLSPNCPPLWTMNIQIFLDATILLNDLCTITLKSYKFLDFRHHPQQRNDHREHPLSGLGRADPKPRRWPDRALIKNNTKGYIKNNEAYIFSVKWIKILLIFSFISQQKNKLASITLKKKWYYNVTREPQTIDLKYAINLVFKLTNFLESLTNNSLDNPIRSIELKIPLNQLETSANDQWSRYKIGKLWLAIRWDLWEEVVKKISGYIAFVPFI